MPHIIIMKKTLVTIILFCIAFPAFSQFSSSSAPLYYVYEYTDTDGIKSKNIGPEYLGSGYVIIFKNNVAVEVCTSENAITDDTLRNDDVNTANKELSEKLQKMAKRRPDSYNDAHSVLTYCSDLSTHSKKTYRYRYRGVNSWMDPGNFMMGIMPSSHDEFIEWEWRSSCYSFSNDQSQMIVWDYDNPIKKEYFKRVSPQDLKDAVKKNLDFLYD